MSQPNRFACFQSGFAASISRNRVRCGPQPEACVSGSYQSRAARVLDVAPKLGRLEPRDRTTAVVERVFEDGRYFCVELKVPDFWQAEHTLPGQYVSVVIDTEPRFLVLANAPGERWLFLIEPTDTLTQDDLKLGKNLGVSKPEGPGYPVDRGGPVLMLAVGSAIASLRPAWRSLLAQDGDRRIRIVYAESDVADLAFRDELDDLALRANTEVDLVLPELLAEATEFGVNSRFSAFICGPPNALQPAVERLLRLGIAETGIFTNL